MTNYLHCHEAGHFSYFLLKYGNIYKYSQQGWENVNGVMKRCFHSKTQMGGGYGSTSKLKPMLETFGRGMLWRFGYGDGLFAKYGFENSLDIKYKSIPKMPTYKDENVEEMKKLADFILKTGSPADLGMAEEGTEDGGEETGLGAVDIGTEVGDEDMGPE